MKERKTTRLRNLLRGPGVLVAPCAYDCVSLRIIEKAGFQVALHGGLNASASLLGLPDVGLITLTETVGAARNMAAAVDIPVLCDIDEGYGNINNVVRATREVIRAGLAGLYVEDQVYPKKCPALEGGKVVSQDEMIRKLHGVIRVRDEEDSDFVVIARTHAGRVIGFDEALKRGLAYAKEGADAVFVDIGYSQEAIGELKAVAREIGPYAHVIANMTETVGRPLLTARELYEMGFKIVIYPLTAILSAAGALTRVFRELAEAGTTASQVADMMPFRELSDLLGIEAVREQERLSMQ
jgi:2,3-dimethylmalate lyase